jgi:hypothetical protein
MRRQRGRRHSEGVEVALANFALTFAKALLVFSVVLFVMISPKDESDGTKPKAEYLISLEWSSTNGKYDVDLWARLPDTSVVSFQHKESGVVFLERDDRGIDCGLTTNMGFSANVCEEIMVIRGVTPGIFELSMHLFSMNGSSDMKKCPPILVNVKIEKLNPQTKVVWRTTIELNAIRQEKPIVKFYMIGDGSLDDFTRDNLDSVTY